MPTDARLLGVVHDLTMRVAESNGFGVAESEAITSAVDEASTEAMQQHPLERGLVDIRYQTRGQRLEIGVYYPCPVRRCTPPSAKDLAAASGMERGKAEGTVYHRLVRDLPPRERKT
jgi:hypothetical protein